MTIEIRSDKSSVLKSVRDVLLAEANAIIQVADKLAASITDSIELISHQSGRIIFTGIGKMGCIGRKAAATFCSTGTPAIFLHAGEAAHGDLGIVTRNDVVIALSNSGKTDELLNLLPYLRRLDIPIICITGNPDSELARHSQFVIDISVAEEADPEFLAPTSTSTVALAICDALAIALARMRGFTKEQFAMFHPGGHLGRKLFTTTAALMRRASDIPLARESLLLRDAIVEMSAKHLGSVIVVDAENRLAGIITDGDIRRILERHENPLEHAIAEIMTPEPACIEENSLAAEALRIMEDKKITVLPVVDSDNAVVGIVHLHMLIQAGLA